MAVDFTRHQNKVQTLTQQLTTIANTVKSIPFNSVEEIAGRAVIEIINKNPTQCSKHRRKPGNLTGQWMPNGGGSATVKDCLTRSVGGNEVAYDHFAEYFFFDYPDRAGVPRKIIIGLGYDSRHWIWSGDLRIPWRVLLSPDGGVPSDIPDYVEKRIRDQNMRDGFTWMVLSGKHKGLDYTFIRIPEKYLENVYKVSCANNSDAYISLLADATLTFLKKLFKP